jgi:OFA family oxalate/formate antiporter-like MFS transporter
LCALAPASFSGFFVLALGRLATGIGAGVGIVATFVIVFEAVAAEKRPLVSAVVWSGFGLAIIASGLAVSYLLETAIGWRVAFALSALLAIAVAISFPPRAMRSADSLPQTPAEGGRFDAANMLGTRWLFLVLAYLLFGIAYVAYSTFAGARLVAIGAPVFVIGATWVVLGVTSIIGALVTIPMLGSERVKRIALFASLFFGTIGSLVASGPSPSAAFFGALVVGLGLAATPTIVSAYARERCSAAEYPRAFSIASAMLGVGQLIGPIAGGAAGDWFGTAAIPLVAACAYGLAAVFAAIDGALLRRDHC